MNLLCTRFALTHERYALLLRVAVGHIDVDEHSIHIQALLLCPSCNLSHERDSRNRVFVANEVLSKEAVALLTTTKVASLALVLTHHSCNPLEAGEYVVELDVLLLGNRLDSVGSNDSLHDILVAGELTKLLVACHEVVEEDHHNLVTINQFILTLGILDNHTDAVGIGVRSHNDVGIYLLSLGNSHCHSRSVLWVRRIYCWEVSTLDFLLGHADDICESEVLERTRNEIFSCSVNRCIDDLQVVVLCNHIGAERKFLDLGDILRVDILTDNLDKVFVALKFHLSHALNLVHIVDGVGIVRSHHLGTIVPVSLVAVVLFWVMRSCNDYTALATEQANCIRHFRSWARAFKKIDLDAIGGEDVGNNLSKETAVVTNVMTNDNRNLLHIGKSVLQVVGKTLSGSTHSVDIHTV